MADIYTGLAVVASLLVLYLIAALLVGWWLRRVRETASTIAPASQPEADVVTTIYYGENIDEDPDAPQLPRK